MELRQRTVEDMVSGVANISVTLARTYKNKKVLVTGHTGFKGSWMLCMLHILQARVLGFALPPHEPSLYTQIEGNKLAKSIYSDIRNKEELHQVIADFEPDFIFHLAAQPLVRQSYKIPSETFEVNVNGTVNLLETVRILDKPCTVVVITTDKVYENKEWIYPYRESDALGGYDPYSASKACAEIAVNAYRQSFFKGNRTGLATARAGNVIGGGDWAQDRIIPDIIRALERGQPVVVRNPDSVRPWQHVLEPLTAYLFLGAKLADNPSAFSEAYNFGPYTTDNAPVINLVKTMIAIWGSGEYQFDGQKHTQHEAGLLRLDISKATDKLSWQPKLSIKETLELTVQWYKQYRTVPAAQLTEKQVKDYWQLFDQ